ncbi:MAG: GIY-YIG nuclease family protein [Drouetiella hepatica Uher 2000/2452]|jgi:hypothetical protein|uniref:GIY-YIG nuclease family protein n=1 Tax=Drouetiella hepatica Uher 2000/2452 TaxID=904376 RepID=A0A951UP44_9CYAN|nr:GIY-YIG nuclease family protein [Drouetiella hepatica Uher 2000/2452]
MTALAELDYIVYLDAEGQMTDQFDGKVGVYAIFDQEKILQMIGYSRDVGFSLKQHLVRQPQSCYWMKVQTIDRPSRTLLEEMRAAWIAENGSVPVGNAAGEAMWNQAIDAKLTMTAEELAIYEASDDPGKIKTLKKVARRVEEEVLAKLDARGVKMPIRFDPKLKEKGLLNL